ncbi:hypothetical protein E2562_011889 [Oryza meyeriana var. granulata]|uniref:WRC domain-containing protein n=1 Tax=Oryza meyeriana var. granulata TaxID=110450 RepID=A0A6G1CFJ9_9ORYZ|nr:hypothetical protein E2562_011889 [Oryza meyeriana var. granulata]
MRIRKCASRLLGSSYSAAAAPPVTAPGFEQLALTTTPPPPPPLPYPGARESGVGVACFAAATASGELCELSRSPWDLIGELDISDPQEEDVVEKYFVHVASRANWLFPTTMPAAVKAKGLSAAGQFSTKPPKKFPKKTIKKPAMVKKKEAAVKEEDEPTKKVKAKKEEGDSDSAPAVAAAAGGQIWTCKKNDGKRWHCQRRVSQPNSLCDYHSDQKKRAYYNPLYESPTDESAPAPDPPSAPPASSKPSTSSKARKKKVADAGEGFYYYTGFGPFRTKRHCRSSHMQEPTPVEHGDEEEQPQDAAPSVGKSRSDDDATDHQPLGIVVASRDDLSSSDDDDIAGIAGGDEESSDDARICNGNGRLRASINGDAKKKTQARKRWRKPVKARSLKSLM